MTTLADRIAIAERKCRGCAAPLNEHPDIPWCDRCLRDINRAYHVASSVTRLAEDRRLPAKLLS